MAARNKPYEQFGPYVLFKKLEQDALGDLWRAGRIENGQLGPTLALRRLSGGHRSALISNVEAVAQLLPSLTGPSFARDQVGGVADGVPFLGWDYAGGRSLRYIIDRARGGKDTQPNPLPLDQAIVVAEKTALSLATIADLRDSAGARLSHGALLPQFIWISDDGEIRVAGQQMGPGVVASLGDARVSADVARYFAPELRSSGQVPRNADVYSLGAILFLLVTGQEPPDAATASAFVAAVRATRTMLGAPIPDDIRIVLDKSFNLDPSMRYATVADMKQALSALAHGGKYSASTFNLAFYLSTLLKKETEVEALDREKESKLNVAPYLEVPRPVAAAPAVVAPAAPPREPAFREQPRETKSRLPIAIAAAVVLAVLAGAAWMMMGRNVSQPATTTSTNAQVLPVSSPAPRPVLPEPILASGSSATTTAAVTATQGDAAAQKKAFEEAVRQKMQAEMSKLNEQYMADLQRQQSRNAPVAAPAPATPAPVSADERGSVSAAQLDQQRRELTRQEEAARVPAAVPVATQTVAPSVQPAAPVPVPAAAVPQSSVREGDVVQYSDLDAAPRATRRISAVYPPIARQQRVSGTVILSALIDENGSVADVKVLRGVGRLGLDEAAARAMRNAKFTSPMKDGKRVKTWWPQTIQFEP